MGETVFVADEVNFDAIEGVPGACPDIWVAETCSSVLLFRDGDVQERRRPLSSAALDGFGVREECLVERRA